MRWLCQCFAHKHSNSAVVPSAPGICISHQMCWLWVHARGGGLLLVCTSAYMCTLYHGIHCSLGVGQALVSGSMRSLTHKEHAWGVRACPTRCLAWLAAAGSPGGMHDDR